MKSSPSTTTTAERATRRLVGLWVALLIVSVAWTGREIPGFDYALLMDDDTNILFNAHLGELDGARLWWMFTDIKYVARYMPLGWLSFNYVAGWGDLSPGPCHVAGVAFHVLNTLLVFFCLRLVAKRFSPGAFDREQIFACGIGALVWALHPLRAEPVAWCSGLIYVEGGFFALLSVYARLRELEARRDGGGRPNTWLALAVAMFALSLLTYPVALCLPGIFLLLDFCWCRRSTSRVRWMLLGGIGLMGGLATGALAVTLAARTVLIDNGLPPPSLEQFGIVARIFQAGYVWAAYIWRTILPVELKPTMEAIFVIRAQDVRIWAAYPTLILLSIAAWHYRRSAAFFGVCWLGYLFWMIPVLGLTEHPHVAADRYSYLSAVLFSGVLVLSFLRLPPRARAMALVLGMAIAAVLGELSTRQARLWRDAMTMHEHALQRLNDEDLRKITSARIAKLRFMAGEVREGRALGEKVYAAAPHIAGVARSWREMQPSKPLSVETAARPLQEWRVIPWALLHDNIAADHLREGRNKDALVRLNAALALSPNYVEARFRRALVRAELGDASGAAHDWLVLDVTPANGISSEGMRFLAAQISAAFQAKGELRLANAMLSRVAPGSP